MSERCVVWWEDVSREAEPIFRVWTDARELDWAKESWEALARRGLTSYSDQIERTLVFVRLMALGGIYLDFCELAFDEIHDGEYTMWADELGLSTFRVAQRSSVFPFFSDTQASELRRNTIVLGFANGRSKRRPTCDARGHKIPLYFYRRRGRQRYTERARWLTN